eukprot:4020844-Ditylum_brightwellii.AAC.1
MEATTGGLAVSSTKATIAQVQNSTGTDPEGAAAASEATILQPLPNLLSPLQQENHMIPTADMKPSAQDSTPILELHKNLCAFTTHCKYTKSEKPSTCSKDVPVSDTNDVKPTAIVRHEVSPDAKSTSMHL